MPEPHIGGLVAGAVLHRLVRRRLVPGRMGHAVGWPLVAAGSSIVVWAVHAADEIDVEAPERLVAEGPYAYSRNPMYLAWTLLYAGTSFVLNSSWPLRLLPLVLGATHAVVLREERDLEARFGTSYRSYKARVRRYL